MSNRHRLALGLSLLVVALACVAGLPRQSTAQDAPQLWFRVRPSVIVPPGSTWQAARPGSTQTMGGVSFTFEVTPPLAMVETLDDGRYSAVMVGCDDRARVRRAMMMVGQRHGPRKDVQAVVEVYCGASAPTD